MTQVFQDDGTMVAVSVLAIEPNTVTRLRTPERDGYTAVQLGTRRAQARKLTKPVAGQLKDLPQLGTLREFRVDDRGRLRGRPDRSRSATSSPTATWST